MTKKLQKLADAIETEWVKHPRPTPTERRLQAYTETQVLLRELVDLIRDNVR